jgi:MYXO-CTERM domain-containing protein
MLLERSRYIQASDDVATSTLYAAMALLLLCAALFSRRSRRYVRGKSADQISRINPYV